MTIPADNPGLDVSAIRVVTAGSNRGVAGEPGDGLVPFQFRRKTGRPLPGDYIRLDAAGAVERIEPRRNQFGRGDPRGRFKPIAANLDQVLIVIAPRPAPSPDLLHRYLAAAHIQNITPLIVVNKTDLPLPEAAPFNELDGLAALGYEVLSTRCEPDVDTSSLPARLEGRTSLLAGQSGVGKSTLLNALVPDLEIQTGSLSTVTGKGTHTTTSATLYRYGDDGWLVDTPGVWEYGLWIMDSRTLMQGFPELAEPAASCRFRNCLHRTEPACGVRTAVENGEVPAFRHQAWLRLLDEQARLAGKKV